VPMLAQITSAPLHILSMHMYLRKGELPPSLPPRLLSCFSLSQTNPSLSPSLPPSLPPSEATWGSRVAEIAKGYRNVVTGRVMRIIPAFGVGGVVNDVREREGGREGRDYSCFWFRHHLRVEEEIWMDGGEKEERFRLNL